MKWAKFDDVLEIKNGRNQKQVENPDGIYPIYGSGGIMGYADDYICDAETVIIGRKGSINNPIFVEQPFWNVDTAFGLSAKKELLTPKYLYYFCQQFDFNRLNTTVTIPSLTKANLLNINIPLPPLDKQRRIAVILDKANAIRRKRQQSLELADSLLKSVFLDMFGDPLMNPKGWDTLELCEVAEIISGVTKGKKYNGQQLVSVPYMRVANVQDGRILLNDIKYIEVTPAELQRYELAAGDILLTEGGDPDKLGRGAIWQGEVENCIHQNHIFRVRISAKNVSPDYLNALVGSQYGKRYFMQAAKQTTGIASINKTQLSKFPTQIPPLGLQNKFATIVQKVEAHKQLGMQGQQEADDLFKALQQQFFS